MPSRRFFAILIPWLAAIAVALGASLDLGRVSTDLTRLLPRGDAPEEQLLLGQLREGPATRLILIAVGGGERVIRPVMIAAILLLAGRMLGAY